MNKRELLVKTQLEAEGWKVLHKGWPDFLLVKIDSQGNPVEWKTREVKSEFDKLTYEQAVVQKILKIAGISCETQVVNSRALATGSLSQPSPLCSKLPLPEPIKTVHLSTNPYFSQPNQHRLTQTRPLRAVSGQSKQT